MRRASSREDLQRSGSREGGMRRASSREDLQQQEANLAFIRSISQDAAFVSSTSEWRRRQVQPPGLASKPEALI